jgi:basic amino acid/polyamine antiporter, APA family
VRRLGLSDAVVVGLASMLGAGVFAAFGPAAATAGAWLPLALLAAGAVAYANAISSARLAARYPESGGSYVYGRERLGPGWGFLAGWCFVVGKTASCAAVALTLGAYVWPELPAVPAVVAVVVLTGVNLLGITRTAAAARVFVAITLFALAVVVVAGLVGGEPSAARFAEGPATSAFGVLQAAGLLFFAFAGYARIATLGGDVRDPAQTIPRAIRITLGTVLGVYAVVCVTALLTIGPAGLARSIAPLADVAGGLPGASVVVRVGAAVACAGVLLTLLAGVGRTANAMAEDRELPAWYRGRSALVLTGVVVAVLVVAVDLRGVIAASGVGVLLYYAVANASALTLDRRSRPVAVGGLLGCLLLAATLPTTAMLVGLGVVALGVLGRAARVRLHP